MMIFDVLRALIYKLRFQKIGVPSKIGKPLRLYHTKGVSMGKRVRILPGARIECHGSGKINIGDDVSIGQNFHLVSGGSLTIGSHVTLSGNVFISNLEHSYREIDTMALEQESVIREVSIGDYCFIGYGACILPGTMLGNNVIVGANSVVKGSYPDPVVIAGIPAKIIKKYDPNTKEWVKYEEDSASRS